MEDHESSDPEICPRCGAVLEVIKVDENQTVIICPNGHDIKGDDDVPEWIDDDIEDDYGLGDNDGNYDDGYDDGYDDLDTCPHCGALLDQDSQEFCPNGHYVGDGRANIFGSDSPFEIDEDQIDDDSEDDPYKGPVKKKVRCSCQYLPEILYVNFKALYLAMCKRYHAYMGRLVRSNSKLTKVLSCGEEKTADQLPDEAAAPTDESSTEGFDIKVNLQNLVEKLDQFDWSYLQSSKDQHDREIRLGKIMATVAGIRVYISRILGDDHAATTEFIRLRNSLSSLKTAREFDKAISKIREYANLAIENYDDKKENTEFSTILAQKKLYKEHLAREGFQVKDDPDDFQDFYFFPPESPLMMVAMVMELGIHIRFMYPLAEYAKRNQNETLRIVNKANYLRGLKYEIYPNFETLSISCFSLTPYHEEYFQSLLYTLIGEVQVFSEMTDFKKFQA